MKKLLGLTLITLTVGCGQSDLDNAERYAVTRAEVARDYVYTRGPENIIHGDQDRSQDGAQGDTGERGESGVAGERGERGESGVAGTTGSQGERGESGDNGLDGLDGLDGTDGILSVVDPCGDGQGPDEVVIFTDSGVLAWYNNVGLSVLAENVTYQTTDNQKCLFRIENGVLVEL